MSLIDSKKEVHSGIGALTSMQQQTEIPNSDNTIPSINNKKEIIPFLLDILKVIAGSAVLSKLTGELFTNFLDDIEPKLKDGLKKQTINENSGDNLPNNFINNGINMPISNIDLSDKLKTDPNSDTGDLIYSDDNDNFDKKAREAIVNDGSVISYNVLNMTYNSSNDTMTFKPTPTKSSSSIGDWIGEFIDGIELINKKEIMSNVMDSMFGTISSNQDKTENKIFNELKIRKLLEKAINNEEDFELKEDELNSLFEKANQIFDGNLKSNLGCVDASMKFDLDSLSLLINDIKNTNDAFDVSSRMNKVADDIIEDNDVDEENSETLKDSFFQRIINEISISLVNSLIATPQVRAILGLISAFDSEDGESIFSADFSEDIKEIKNFVKCIVKELLSLLNEYIYTLILILLVKLLKPAVRKIIMEKINSYIGVIKSLIPVDV